MDSQQRHERAKDDAKGSNDFARVGAQSAILINGGAATAILAFIGSTARNVEIAKVTLPLLPPPLFLYALGVFLAALSLMVMSRSLEWYMDFWRHQSESSSRRGTRLWWAGLVLVAISLGCFAVASAYLAFQIGRIHLP